MIKANWKPFMMFGLMIIMMFGLMIGLMMIIMTMSFGSGGGWTGMWAVMVIPFLGMLLMPLIMFFFFRRMAGSGGSMSGWMSRMMGHSHTPRSQNAQSAQSEENNTPTLTYNVPAVNCGHCKMTIEREVGDLSGVASVSVDVDAKQAVIKLVSPPTEARIEALLAEIGYPPESV